MSTFKKTALSAALLALTSAASAGIVTNDTELLSGTGHQQLSTWLGEDVDLTRIFAKGIDGSTSQDWHAHVDNRGRTFSVIEVFNGAERRIIGGYNKFSWHSGNDYTRSELRENFLFNLTGNMRYQKNNHSVHQAYNSSTYGPTFGGGHDLYINQGLAGGYANLGYGYGDSSRIGQTSYRAELAGSYNTWTVGKLETFTLSASTGTFGSGAMAMTDEQGNAVAATNVSAPIGLGALSLSLLIFGARRRT
jgi:hypothetical protein